MESLYPAMWYKLNICLNQDGKLEYDRKKSKEEILKIIYGLLRLGSKSGHKIEVNEKMTQYFEEFLMLNLK